MGAGTFCVPLLPPSVSHGLGWEFERFLQIFSLLFLSFNNPLINWSLIHPADVPVTSLALCPFPTLPYALYLLITVNDRVLLCSLPLDKAVNTIGVTGKTPFLSRSIFQIALQRGQLFHPAATSCPRAEFTVKWHGRQFPTRKAKILPISCCLPWNCEGLSGKLAPGSSGQV